MAEATDVYGILHQNLTDVGCSTKVIADCMVYARKGEWKRMLPILIQHKEKLLLQVHKSQEQIDCLDFLVYRIGKEYGGK